jgi:hypothetical protein
MYLLVHRIVFYVPLGITNNKLTMKTEKYKDTFKSMLIAAGRKKKWVADKLGYNKIGFYRAIHNDTLSDTQKSKIANLLSK